jgi:homoserine kinase
MLPVRARAYGSIANFGHGFDVFGMAVDVAWDMVELRRRRQRGLTLEVHGPARVPTAPGRNTAGVALTKLLSDHGIRAGLRVRIAKHGPVGGGLGSSAASAAAAVTAANRLFGLGLSRTALVRYAAHGERASAGAPHADNAAAALLGGFVIVDRDDPPHVVHLTPPRALRFAIAIPRVAFTTAEARRVLPRRIALDQHTLGCARAAMAVAAIARGDVRALGRALAGSFAERARAPLVPGFADVCASARRAGAAGATLSGAGPAIMAVVDARRADPRAVGRAMQAAFARAGLEAEAHVARAAAGARVLGARP